MLRVSKYLVLLCLFLGACAEVNNKPNSANADLTKQANAAFAKGDYASASGLYEKILVSEPQNQDAMFRYAEALRISGNTAKSLDEYNQLIEKDKNNLAAIEGRGLCYLQSGDVDSALRELNSVVEKDAARWRTLNAMGVAYSIQGKDEDAMKYYNMALEVSGGNASIANNIALGMAFSGQSAKGIALLKNTISGMAEGDKKKILQNNLALIYGVSGKMDEAEAILRKTLPEHAVYNNLGFYAKLASDKNLASDYLTKAISANPVYYEKAENNLKDLDSAQEKKNAVVISNSAAQPNSDKDKVGQVAVLSGTQPAAEAQTDAPKIPPVKVWRGTHRLPLPTLRPQL